MVGLVLGYEKISMKYLVRKFILVLKAIALA